MTRRERATLEHLLRRGHTGLWIAARARAVLLAATGQTVSGIARVVGRDRKWVRRWLHSPDPEFRRKVRRIVRLYLHARRGTRVLCVDEKTQVQIREPPHPSRPLTAGRPQRIEVHYRRHGTLAVLAGLDVRSGQVVLWVRRRRRHHEFLELLQALRARWPRGKLVIVLDNLSIHTTPAIQAWLQAQGGLLRFEWLPFHASWLNQIGPGSAS